MSNPLPDPQYLLNKFEGCFADALAVVTPLLSASATRILAAPNPLLQVVQPLARGKIGAKINIGLPVQQGQIEEIRSKIKPTHVSRVGRNCIQAEDLNILNLRWKTWIQKKAEKLVSEKFEIKKAELQFEFAFVATKGEEVTEFEDELHKKKDLNTFAKLLVILPSFDEFKLTFSLLKSANFESLNYEPGRTADLTLAIWYHGVRPTLVSEGTTLCLLYSVHVQSPHSYLPWQLALPDTSPGVMALKKCLNDWLYSVRRDENAVFPKFLTWMLDNNYSSLERIHTNDRGRIDMLVEAAKDIGFKVYLVDLTRMMEGAAVGWIDRESYDYDRYSEIEDIDEAYVDADGLHEIDYDEPVYESITLENWQDLRMHQSLHQSVNCSPAWNDNRDDWILPQQEWEVTKSLMFEEEYDPSCGALQQKWRRSALVLWPEEMHSQTVLDTFYDYGHAAHFLEPTLWVGENNLEDRIKIVEGFILHPDTENLKTPIEECKLAFLYLALEANRSDLFIALLDMSGLPEPGNMGIIGKAIEQFSNHKTTDRLVSMCVKKEGSTKRKIQIIAKIFGNDSSTASAFIQKSFRSVIFGSIFTIDELWSLAKDFGNEVFRSLVLPKVEIYHNTEYWLRLLETFKNDKDTLRTYLPLVVSSHKCSFESAKYQSSLSGTTYQLSSFASQQLWKSSDTYLLLHCLMEHKELDLLGTMLKGIVGIKPPHAQKPTEDQYRFYSTVLVQIQDDLAIFKIPLDSHPSIQFFFQTMVLKHFLAPLGPALDAKSAPTKNFSLPGLDCGTSKCDSCHKISSFLVSKNDTSETWTMTKAVRKHIHDALKDRYSHPKNVSVSETQPSGRIGTLTAKKVGMSLANRRKNWEKHRAIIELCLLKIQDSLGEGELRDLIVDAVKKGGLGYSTQLKTMANNLFAQKFPVSTAAASPSQTAHKRQRSVSEISSNSKLESTEMGPPKKRPYTVIDLCDISDEE